MTREKASYTLTILDLLDQTIVKKKESVVLPGNIIAIAWIDQEMARKPHSRKTSHAIPRATFERLVKEIAQDIAQEKDYDYRVIWSSDAIDALHEETQNYISERFSKANFLCDTFKKKTLDMRHFDTAKTL